MSETNKVLTAMFKENTGSHFLDSGGAYGRNHERNQGRNFADEVDAKVEWDYDSIGVTINTYKWLADKLEYSEELTGLFEAFSAESGNDHHMEDMEQWVEKIGSSGLYGEGEPISVNTYNHDNLLDQVIQFTYFELRETDQFEETCDGSYILLQVHGGCDVRGGYTAPKVFQVCDGSEGTAIFDSARATISCNREKNDLPQSEFSGMETEPCEMYWDTDDAYHWYPEGSCGRDHKQLDDHEVTKAENGETWTKGKLHVNEDNSILCPCCGSTVSVGYF